MVSNLTCLLYETHHEVFPRSQDVQLPNLRFYFMPLSLIHHPSANPIGSTFKISRIRLLLTTPTTPLARLYHSTMSCIQQALSICQANKPIKKYGATLKGIGLKYLTFTFSNSQMSFLKFQYIYLCFLHLLEKFKLCYYVPATWLNIFRGFFFSLITTMREVYYF